MVRSSNPNDIFNDIEKSLERAVIDVIDEINTIAISKTPVDTGYAQQQWRTIGKYK